MNGLTNVAQTEPFSILDAADAVRFDYFTLQDFPCPVILFDHVHMRTAGFPPHPHAGLCVITYLFEDSPGSLRDRDSINEEVLVEPGDMLWFQMASGLIHEENPAVDGTPINQMQIWVNLSDAMHSLPPAPFHLKSADVPVVRDGQGNRSRVVLGEYSGVHSPLTPTEPFTLLDLFVDDVLDVPVPSGWTGIVYVIDGTLRVAAGADEREVGPGAVVGIDAGTEARLTGSGVHALYMAKPVLDQPLVIQGMYAMSRQEEIDNAKRRFHAGEFGDVTPYAKVLNPGKPYVPAGMEPDLAVTPVPLHQATVRHYDEGWWKLHLQYCRYEYNNTEIAFGYRFVWENPDGAEEQYRLGGFIPYADYIATLLETARNEGWGDIPYRDSF
ncbi:MAG: pirin family protein [Planctomycetaceae bacterium]|nr:pirin family protein [Planctomycetaceae bacterium]